MSDGEGGFRAYVIVLIIQSVVVIALRFYSRTLTSSLSDVRRFWWDDWAALAAGVLLVAELSVELVMARSLGQHIRAIPPEDAVLFLKLFFISDLLFDFSLFLTKVSALLFFTRIFPLYTTSRRYNVVLWIIHGLNIAWVIAVLLLTVLSCTPVRKVWLPTTSGYCQPLTPAYLGSATGSVFIDLLLLILPLPRIWSLQTSLARKFGITLVFVLGCAVVVVSLGRMITLIVSKEALDTDPTFLGVTLFYWFSAEVPISILCICLPAMLPLGHHLNNRFIQPLTDRLPSFSISSSSHRSNRRLSRDHRELYESSKGARAIRLDSNTHVPYERRGDVEAQRSGSEDSRKAILNFAICPDNHHTAEVQRGNLTTPRTHSRPDGIWVEDDVRVSSHTK
ncbi:uncharacterized protein F4822DRAFT_113165 [Hypoxylon trugodes]|uniref:uncharacterized protein n=1 Tax=Hypoxylon trugodes TaxID=326681 RepID=UPI00219AE10B|nr:uncharacterized protein F4822DRAFT_113165 [Hypoxylon trugodes]KAI1392014.1 hypothetical protein F4822DRAFT_113165 [Hypoxylon trugodes]